MFLVGNQIASIEAGAFSGLTNLTYLDLYNNQLTSLEPGTFSGLGNLTELNLGGNQLSTIEVGDFSGLTNLTTLSLYRNQLTSIEAGTLDGLGNLTTLSLDYNQLSSIEAGAFSGLPNMEYIILSDNPALTELNLADAEFENLILFMLADDGSDRAANIDRVSLKNALVNQTSLAALLDGGHEFEFALGFGELDGVTELNLSGIDFINITDLSPLYVMDDLTDLWLAETTNLGKAASTHC